MAESEAVRVAVRIRPLTDRADGAQEILRKVVGEPQLVLGVDRAFTYDHVLEANSEQHEVYDECVQSLVARVLKGYNSTVLAYGQTGSGKTHTMGSGDGEAYAGDSPESGLGIIPRTVRELFGRVGVAGTDLEGATLTAKVSFIEVYKEDIHDLLQRPAETSSEGNLGASVKLATLDIRETKEGGISLPGLHARSVGCPDEAMAALAEGSRNRATGSTQMNATSSRSHAIFTVSLELTLKGGKILTPRFNFVDLAGSERAKRTGASGDRFAEGVQINKGLLALGNVISALCEKQSHVPYRDSKLTRLLQDSLGGNAHTLMIACVSPSDADLEESLNTLKYANRARQIQNKLLIAQDPVQARIAELMEQVAMLTARLQHYEAGGGPLGPLPAAAAASGLVATLAGGVGGGGAAASSSGGAVAAAPTAGKNTDLALQRCQQLQHKLEAVRAAQAAKTSAAPPEAGAPAAAGAAPAASEAAAAPAPAPEDGAPPAAPREAFVEGAPSASGEAEEQRPEEAALKQEQLEEELEFLTKQGEMSEALATLDESLALKQELLKAQEDDDMAAEVEEMQRALLELEASVKETGRERDELTKKIAELQEKSDAKAQALRESFARKLETAEAQLRSLRNQQSQQKALLNARVAAERRVKELGEEIGTIKAQKVALSRRMREDADSHRAQHQARERELKAVRRKEEKTAAQLDRLQQDHAKQAAVLKRKHEEIAALQRRGVGGPPSARGGMGPARPQSARGGLTRPDHALPNVMNKVTAAQQARLADSKHVQHECATILGARPKEWFVGEVESAVSLQQAREEKEVLIEKRRQATVLLAAKEAAATAEAEEEGAAPAGSGARGMEEVKARVASHSRDISVLNQRLSQREDGAHTKIETISSISMSKALLRCAFDTTVAAQLALSVRSAQLAEKDRAVRDASDLTNTVRLQLYSERAKAQAREKRDAEELAALAAALAALRTEAAAARESSSPRPKPAALVDDDFARLERRLQQKARPVAARAVALREEESTEDEMTTEDETDESEVEEEAGSDVDWVETDEAKETLPGGGRPSRRAASARAVPVAATSGMFANMGETESVATRRGRRTSVAPWADAEGTKPASPPEPPPASARDVEPLLDRLSRKTTKARAEPPPPAPPAARPPASPKLGSARPASADAASRDYKGMHERHGVDELRANLANVRRKLGAIDSNKAPEVERSASSKESVLVAEGSPADDSPAVAVAEPPKEPPKDAAAGAAQQQAKRKLNNPKVLKQGAGLLTPTWTVQVDL